jgi:hypothetical protein
MPEQARVIAHLNHCDDDRVNDKTHFKLVNTSESFRYDLTFNEEHVSFEGCSLKRLVIKDKTPSNSPFVHGFDLNSLEIKNL